MALLKAPVPLDDDRLQKLVEIEADFEFKLESVALDLELGLAESTMTRAYEQKLREVLGGD